MSGHNYCPDTIIVRKKKIVRIVNVLFFLSLLFLSIRPLIGCNFLSIFFSDSSTKASYFFQKYLSFLGILWVFIITCLKLLGKLSNISLKCSYPSVRERLCFVVNSTEAYSNELFNNEGLCKTATAIMDQCLRCSWWLSTPLLFEHVVKIHRCFLLMLFFRASDRWEVKEHMSHDRSGTIIFLVHVHGQYLLYLEGVTVWVALKIRYGDKTIMFSEHMLSNKAFFSKWKLALFTL